MFLLIDIFNSWFSINVCNRYGHAFGASLLRARGRVRCVAKSGSRGSTGSFGHVSRSRVGSAPSNVRCSEECSSVDSTVYAARGIIHNHLKIPPVSDYIAT